MNVAHALQRAMQINQEIKMLLKEMQYDQYEDLSGLDLQCTAEEELLRDELRYVASKYDDARRTLNYLNREIAKTGKLFLNSSGRYELDGDEYTSGSTIEYLYYDDFKERERWSISRVESSNGKYYIYGNPKLEMDGLTVRRREQPGLYEF